MPIMPHNLYPPDLATLLISQAGEKWRPSNGGEGELFMNRWCATCAMSSVGSKEGGGIGCPISAATFWHQEDEPGYPAEWCLSATGQPQCTAYVPKEP